MNLKKLLLAGSIAILGLAVVSGFAQMDKSKSMMPNHDMKQMKPMFVDENGDGINDMRGDHGKMMQNGNHDGMMDNHDNMSTDHKDMHDGMRKGSMCGMTNSMMRGQMSGSGAGMPGGSGSMSMSGQHGRR
jgi:hypothetical protein